MELQHIHAREILDSRGNPTHEVEVILADGATGRAVVPSVASTGAHEAVELRDGDKKRYLGKGTLKAVNNVNEILAPRLLGLSALDQVGVDRTMLEIDGTENNAKLSANVILKKAMAVAAAVEQPQHRTLRVGLVGGGQGAFIGRSYATSAILDNRAQLVAGAMSSVPAKARAAASHSVVNVFMIYSTNIVIDLSRINTVTNAALVGMIIVDGNPIESDKNSQNDKGVRYVQKRLAIGFSRSQPSSSRLISHPPCSGKIRPVLPCVVHIRQ